MDISPNFVTPHSGSVIVNLMLVVLPFNGICSHNEGYMVAALCLQCALALEQKFSEPLDNDD